MLGITQENLVNRVVDSFVDSFSGKENPDSDVENMESNFKSLMARKVDVENEISIKEEQGRRKKRKREVEDWLEEVKEVEGEYHAFVEEEERKGLLKKIFDGNHEAIELNRRICHLHKRSQDFGEVVADDRITGIRRPTIELEGAAFQDNLKRIWSLLENDQVSSIGVHGMGGVGKSTLVEHINNLLVERKKCVFWVVVSSQSCSIKMLQDKIARKLRLDLSDEDDDEGARAGRLNDALSQRENFVLILDDVWECINMVKVGIPLSSCKWMITSRSLNVCREMNCQEKIAVKPLSENEGWNLFLKNLGQDATSTLRDSGVEGIAKRMVKICDGLPLGIITLAGAMSGVTEIHEWRYELQELEESVMGHNRMEETVFRVLKYSFDRLNLNDQRCFLYCALYPEDCLVPMKELVRNLISEKLVDDKKRRIAQSDEGHSIVTRLVKVSLLESGVSDDYRGVECVKMHDLVREMALKITKGKYMVTAWEKSRKKIPIEEEWTEGLEKVSLMMNKIEEIPDGISPNCPKLTTLILPGNPLKRIATSFFTQMCGLRTLDLSYTNIVELPDSVSDLLNLTSLLLEGCENLERVPCVGKLKELRELDLSGTSIWDVPEGIEELRPRLWLLRLPFIVEMELVEGWERLEVFEGRLKHMSDFNRLVASKHDRVSYAILLGFYDFILDWKYDGITRKLELWKYDLKGGEENELTTILADYIQYLKFHLCKGMSKSLLDDLSNPTSLQKLKIIESGGIECMLTNEQYKAPQGSKSPFQAIEVIYLRGLEDFMGVIHNLEIESDPPPSSVFSSLRSLIISGCHGMKKLGLPLCIFEKLEYVSIEHCWEIEEIIQVSAANESDDALFVSLPNLEELHLVDLKSLESFCNAPLICNSLKKLRLEDCPKLQVPFLNWGTPDSYKPLFPGEGVDEIRRQSL